MNVYKVVLPVGCDEYVSSDVEGDARISYELNRETTAPDYLAARGYHPLCFATREDAEKYAMWTNVILLCQAEGIITDLPEKQSVISVGRRRFYPAADPWPDGSLMARSLTPLEVVTNG